MADQSNRLSAKYRITDRSHDAVTVLRSRPKALTPEIDWTTYSNRESLAARRAGLCAFGPLANFFKNNLHSEAKNPAVRIPTGDDFAMEDIFTPGQRNQSGNFHRLPRGYAEPATALNVLPVIWAKDQTKHVCVRFHGHFRPPKKSCEKIKKFLPVRICRLDHLGHDERSKIPAAPRRPKIPEKLQNIFWAKPKNMCPFALLFGTVWS